ncbi:MAG: amidohydrolase family protein, partial [Steroidobacteraceae bacterium]
MKRASPTSIAHQPLALVNARLIDPARLIETAGGVLVADGVIRDIGAAIAPANLPAHARIIDCGGDCVAPGLIDMWAFIGEPGAEHRETIATATLAAAAGGITTVVARPDTNPPVDEAAVVDFLLRRARDTGRVRVLPLAALTAGLDGAEIAEIGLLQLAGAVAFSDGARAIRSARVLRRVMQYARDFNALVIHHAEDPDLAAEGVMNEGEFASRLGLAGIAREAEAIMLDRDIRLVNLTGARYHAALVTTALSLDIIAKAKADGLSVTCATSINHLTLNENDIGDYRTFLKLAPPLRHEDERRALVAALASGLIDAVVSDHNPQDVETKRLPFTEAEEG